MNLTAKLAEVLAGRSHAVVVLKYAPIAVGADLWKAPSRSDKGRCVVLGKLAHVMRVNAALTTFARRSSVAWRKEQPSFSSFLRSWGDNHS
jgi:hypothetical protein